ncbi:type 1 periplasmic binding fold superfamily protein [Polaribacter sp.]|nr:type 1 periplasmic binding fold superfamily protein [Polaribacter sp.]
MNTIKLLAIFFIATLTFSACSDDDHEDDDHDHEEELITTVTYTLTKGNDAVTLVSTDLDGLGGNDATFNISGPLTANTTYTGVIKLENATEDPAENITEEVEEEGDEHEFFYSSTVSGITINKTDTDTEGNPIGIETTLTTGAAGTGTLTIILKHEPTKPNDNTSTNAGGSTDVEVTFSVTVE